jgi:lambda repressor-like predicted transcriptional regulator
MPAPQRLPATERRRAGPVVKASVAVADEASAAAGLDPSTLATVFSSSTGDPVNCHLLCEALATPQRMISPTRFTNSVHNAPAGYWHIATGSRQPSTSLAAYDASFAAGLLEAYAQCLSLQAPVLLVACDVPYPEPMHALRPVADVFALALVLAPAGGRALRLQLGGEECATRCDDEALDEVRRQIPAARALPLLQALARDAPMSLVLQAWPGMALGIEVDAR